MSEVAPGQRRRNGSRAYTVEGPLASHIDTWAIRYDGVDALDMRTTAEIAGDPIAG